MKIIITKVEKTELGVQVVGYVSDDNVRDEVESNNLHLGKAELKQTKLFTVNDV